MNTDHAIQLYEFESLISSLNDFYSIRDPFTNANMKIYSF